MSALPIDERGGAITFDILVAPRASRERVGPLVGERVKVAVNAPPVEGKANAAIVALLAQTFGVRKQDVEIVSGDKGKRKRVRIWGVPASALRELLEREP